MGIEDMDMSAVGNWNLDGKKETNRESLDIELAEEEEVEPLDINRGYVDAKNAHYFLSEQYENHPLKDLHDALVQLSSAIESLEKIKKN